MFIEGHDRATFLDPNFQFLGFPWIALQHVARAMVMVYGIGAWIVNNTPSGVLRELEHF